jgi:hypothetical protein
MTNAASPDAEFGAKLGAHGMPRLKRVMPFGVGGEVDARRIVVGALLLVPLVFNSLRISISACMSINFVRAKI